jgi:hypothetical protein
MTTKTEAKSLIEKLVEVAQAVRYIEKGGRNSAQNYKFVGEAQVVEKVGPELLERGVLAYPQHRVVGVPFTFTTAQGSVQVLTTIESTWVFTDGVDKVEVVTVGQGTDAGDKGVYKAMTGAKKYGLLQALMIATGDDPEETREDEKAEARTSTKASAKKKETPAEDVDPDAATTSQKNRMYAMAKDAGIDLSTKEGKTTLQAIVLAATGKHSSKELKKDDMDVIFQTLESQAEAVAA